MYIKEYFCSFAEVAEWQTRRSQKPMVGNYRVGSTPTLGTNYARQINTERNSNN